MLKQLINEVFIVLACGIVEDKYNNHEFAQGIIRNLKGIKLSCGTGRLFNGNKPIEMECALRQHSGSFYLSSNIKIFIALLWAVQVQGEIRRPKHL